MTSLRAPARSLFLWIWIAVTTATVAGRPEAQAQTGPPAVESLKEDQRNFTLDLTPPDLSAFALLGINPTEVTRPGTVRELAAALANGISSSGQITPGLALEWAPGQTFGAATSLQRYRETALWRRIALSVATVADGPAIRTAAGVRWVLKDDSDPRTNLRLTGEMESELAALHTDSERRAQTQVITAELINILGPGQEERVGALMLRFFNALPAPNVVAVVPARDAHCRRVKRDIEAGGTTLDDQQASRVCELVDRFIQVLQAEGAARAGLNVAQARLRQRLQRFRDAAWNADAMELAFGTTGIASDGSWSALQVESLRGYGAMAMGMGAHGQQVMKVDFSRFVSGPDRWMAVVGLRGLVGTPDGRASFELAGRFAESSPDVVRLAVGGEVRVGAELWLELQVGDDAPASDLDGGRMVFRANLKYGEAQKPAEGQP
jgi:hypothetical protein